MDRVEYVTTVYAMSDRELLECVGTYGAGYFLGFQGNVGARWKIRVYRKVA